MTDETLKLVARWNLHCDNNNCHQDMVYYNDEEFFETHGITIRQTVMQIKNNYDKDVYNGEIGRIFRIFPEEQEVIIAFDNIARAKPEIDWEQLLKKVDKQAEKRHEKRHIQGGPHEPGTAACH